MVIQWFPNNREVGLLVRNGGGLRRGHEAVDQRRVSAYPACILAWQDLSVLSLMSSLSLQRMLCLIRGQLPIPKLHCVLALWEQQCSQSCKVAKACFACLVQRRARESRDLIPVDVELKACQHQVREESQISYSASLTRITYTKFLTSATKCGNFEDLFSNRLL